MDFEAYQASPEVIEAILLPLEPEDLQSTCRVDSHFASVCDNEAFWERKVRHDLKDLPELIDRLENDYDGLSWKQRYIATTLRPKYKFSESIIANGFDIVPTSNTEIGFSLMKKMFSNIDWLNEELIDTLDQIYQDEFDEKGIAVPDPALEFAEFVDAPAFKKIDQNTFQVYYLIKPDYFLEEEYKPYFDTAIEQINDSFNWYTDRHDYNISPNDGRNIVSMSLLIDLQRVS